MYVGLQPEEDLIADLEGAFTVVLVSLVLHPLLHLEEVPAYRGEDQRALLEPFLNIDRSHLVRSSNTKIPGLVTVEDLEWRLPQ